jgi:hypothetical protein
MINDKGALILAVAVVLAGFLSGGIYTTSGTQFVSNVTNRFTGSTWKCSMSECSQLADR